ncbi:MAG: TolC family protein [Bacteroidota bacterium]
MTNKWKFILPWGLLFSSLCTAQQVISEAEVLSLALKNSALMQVSDLEIQQNKYLQKTSFNLSNPDVIAESPTGEFYAVGILQSVEFPSVYVKQHQLRRQATALSEKGKEVARQDVYRVIRTLYLNLQFMESLHAQLKLQDSLYYQMSINAARQFSAGQIDYLVKTTAESQYGEVHNKFIETQADYETLRNQIKVYAGIAGDFKATPLSRLRDEGIQNLVNDSSLLAENPSLEYAQQLRKVNAKTLSLERNKTLPGLVFGYLNQGPKNTPTYYRFRVGFTVPLWFWQYAGNIKAAKTAVQIAEQNVKAQQQTLTAEMYQALGDLKKFDLALQYYETKGLQYTDDIINASQRFFESGHTDYTNYLRNIDEAYTIKTRYLETLRNYNQSVITINYLTGKL